MKLKLYILIINSLFLILKKRTISFKYMGCNIAITINKCLNITYKPYIRKGDRYGEVGGVGRG